MNAIGTSVLGGMITGTVLVVVYAPLFYVLIEGFGRKKKVVTASGSVSAPEGDGHE